MRFVLELLLAAAAFVGHFSLAVWLFNRLHSVPWPVRLIKVLDKFIVLGAAAVCVWFAVRWFITGHGPLPAAGQPLSTGDWLWLGYAVLCWQAAIAVLPLWLIPKLLERTSPALVSNASTVVDVAERLGFRPIHGRKTRLLASVPGNQLFQLALQRKTLCLPTLPPELDGFTIAHLSDLHMTGHLGPEFYQVIVEETNDLRPDLVVITGDILEKERCLPWGPPLLGRLQSRYGTYFILGNHEMRLPEAQPLRAALRQQGLIDLGSQAIVVEWNGCEVLLAGNELPWFGTAPVMPNPQSVIQNPKFRMLLSHSPDQLPWAKANGFELMLAGHNHGGQIRLPWLGALITPSHYGWRYAGGVYQEPPTLLHVSRGISGDHCIRLNCRPEIALLRLVRASNNI